MVCAVIGVCRDQLFSPKIIKPKKLSSIEWVGFVNESTQIPLAEYGSVKLLPVYRSGCDSQFVSLRRHLAFTHQVHRIHAGEPFDHKKFLDLFDEGSSHDLKGTHSDPQANFVMPACYLRQIFAEETGLLHDVLGSDLQGSAAFCQFQTLAGAVKQLASQFLFQFFYGFT